VQYFNIKFSILKHSLDSNSVFHDSVTKGFNVRRKAYKTPLCGTNEPNLWVLLGPQVCKREQGQLFKVCTRDQVAVYPEKAASTVGLGRVSIFENQGQGISKII